VGETKIPQILGTLIYEKVKLLRGWRSFWTVWTSPYNYTPFPHPCPISFICPCSTSSQMKSTVR